MLNLVDAITDILVGALHIPGDVLLGVLEYLLLVECLLDLTLEVLNQLLYLPYAQLLGDVLHLRLGEEVLVLVLHLSQRLGESLPRGVVGTDLHCVLVDVV